MNSKRWLVVILVSTLACFAAQTIERDRVARTPGADEILSPASHTANFGAAFGPRTWTLGRWSNGAMTSFQYGMLTHPAVAVWDENGVKREVPEVSIPGATSTSVASAVVTPDGKLLAAVGAEDGAGRVDNYIAVSDGAGFLRPLFKTTPFVPLELCSAEGNRVWAFGWQRSAEQWDREAKSYAVLREFDLARGEVRGVLQRATIAAANLPKSRIPHQLALRCAKGRVVLFLGTLRKLVESDVRTGLLSEWAVAELPDNTKIASLETTDSGAIFAVVHKREGPSVLCRLERRGSSAEWTRLGAAGSGVMYLAGFAGDELIIVNLQGDAVWRQPLAKSH
jgi:hypothetical protein